MSDNKSSGNKTIVFVIAGIVILAIIGFGVNSYNMSEQNRKDDEASKKKEDDSKKMMKKNEVMVGGAAMSPDKDIITNASAASNLTTLVAAVKSAGLVATLQGPGPFTVFGPSNEAFTKLPAGTVETLLKPENKAKLTSILTYHVVAGKLDSTVLSDNQMLTTVEGQKLTIMKKDGKVSIKDAKGGMANVLTADVYQSNGVAHIIDSVLMPLDAVIVGGAAMSPTKDIVTNVSTASNLKTVVTALQAAGLVATLQGPGPFTVFGPTDAAFAKLPAGTVETLLKPESKPTLSGILTYHVVAGKFASTDLKDGQTLTTVQGEKLTVMIKGGKVSIKDAKGGVANIETADVFQSNGVAHIIDAVLMPVKAV